MTAEEIHAMATAPPDTLNVALLGRMFATMSIQLTQYAAEQKQATDLLARMEKQTQDNTNRLNRM